MASTSNQALGFIMTVYRRRLTSSFRAVSLSLQRRRKALAAGKALAIANLLDADDKNVTEDDTSGELPGFTDPISADLLTAEIAELDSFMAGIEALGGQDTKADQLYADLTDALNSGYDSYVIFTQYTDTMDSSGSASPGRTPGSPATPDAAASSGTPTRPRGRRSPRTSSSRSSETATSGSSSAPTA